MNVFKHILVPVDFAAGSATAFGVAAALAKSLGARVTLLHVLPLVEPAVSAHQPYGDAAMREPETEVDMVARWELEDGTHVRSAVRRGDVSQEIVAATQECGADLLVMATRGRTGMARALLGSITENVVQRSSVPVLTVHAACAN